MQINKIIYKKHQSFSSFVNKKKYLISDAINEIEKLDISKYLKTFSTKEIKIFRILLENLKNNKSNSDETIFKLNENSIAEYYSFDEEKDKILYLIHRYKYDIFPAKKELDDFPPLIQIEPSSICNFRCVFCFETDKSFTSKKNGHMGQMSFELFREIIDNIEGKIQFVTLASRGEPLANTNFSKIINYTSGKFINLKINTNASLLDEKKCHDILSSNVKTMVFSADAADKDLYAKLRVNGNLDKTLSNIRMFVDIKNKHYPKNKIITRVSGVKFSQDQKLDDMLELWGKLVDQVAFVEYNPWENNYIKEPNNIEKACSDLWRRMFVWWDGKANPCDVDYKSTLSVGNFSKNSIAELWNSKEYNILRKKHLSQKRKEQKPCSSCSVI